MPAVLQALAKEPLQSWDAGTNLSAITVEFMLDVVTHVGLRRTDGTEALAVVSWVEPFTSEDGGVWPART